MGPPTFPLFPTLPQEIQLLIWEHAASQNSQNHNALTFNLFPYLHIDLELSMPDASQTTLEPAPPGERFTSYLRLRAFLYPTANKDRIRLLWVCAASRKMALRAFREEIRAIEIPDTDGMGRIMVPSREVLMGVKEGIMGTFQALIERMGLREA